MLALPLVAAPAPPVAAQGFEAESGPLRFGLGGRVQTQLVHSSVEAAPAVDFLIRRARLSLDVRVAEGLSGRIQTEFAGGGVSLRDAWVRMAVTPSFRLTAGRFKRPFDRFELTSSTVLPVIERDGRIPGLEHCAGVGRVCSMSRFTGALEYADRDLGVLLDGALGGRVRYALALTNGPGGEARDENDRKSFSGRVEVRVTEALELAANVSVHDYLLAPGIDDESDYATAWGADAEWGGILQAGPHAMAGVVAGGNWLADRSDPPRFLAAQTLATWRVPLGGGGFFEAWSPVARVGWGDPSGDLQDDAGLLLTPGVMLWIRGRSGLGANLDVYRPEEGGTEYSLKVQSFLHF